MKLREEWLKILDILPRSISDDWSGVGGDLGQLLRVCFISACECGRGPLKCLGRGYRCKETQMRSSEFQVILVRRGLLARL